MRRSDFCWLSYYKGLHGVRVVLLLEIGAGNSADHTYYFPSGFTLGPGETVTIYTGSGSNSGSELYWGSSSAVWNNGGDTIIVTTDSGETVVNYEY